MVRDGLFDDDPTGRGSGWRPKDQKPSEYEETLRKRMNMDRQAYRQHMKRLGDDSRKFLESLRNKVNNPNPNQGAFHWLD